MVVFALPSSLRYAEMANPPSHQPLQGLSPREVDRIVAESFVEQVEYHAELDSTNSRALQIAHEETSCGGVTLVFAESQTAGRGRGENRWWSGPGALTFSLLLPGEHLSLSTGEWPTTSLIAGLAVGEAIGQFVSGETAMVKWPNDVYLRGRKVCGILVEATSGARGMLAIGIGVNVNNSLAEAPDELASSAIAVCDVARCEVSRVDLLIAILQRLEKYLRELGSGDIRWQEHWRKRCLLTGRAVQLDAHGGRLVGICRGIDGDGALVLETEAGLTRCLSGVIAHFE